MENKKPFEVILHVGRDFNSYHVKVRVRIEVRPTKNDLTRLYKNGDISVVITCS